MKKAILIVLFLLAAACSSEPVRTPDEAPVGSTVEPSASPPVVAGAPVEMQGYSDQIVALSIPSGWTPKRAGGVLYAVSDPSDDTSPRIGVELNPAQALTGIVTRPRALRTWLRSNLGGDFRISERVPQKDGDLLVVFDSVAGAPTRVAFWIRPDLGQGQGALAFLAARTADFEATGGVRLLADVVASIREP